MKDLPTNPDVIVIGGGTAGLAAAKTLRSAGVDVVILEAAPHVGGRCVTDTSIFSVPFDLGGAWLHSAKINPLARLAEQEGKSLYKTPWRAARLHRCGQTLPSDEVDAYQAYQDRMWHDIKSAGRGGTDMAVAGALPNGEWRQTATHCVAQMLAADADVKSPATKSSSWAKYGLWLLVPTSLLILAGGLLPPWEFDVVEYHLHKRVLHIVCRVNELNAQQILGLCFAVERTGNAQRALLRD